MLARFSLGFVFSVFVMWRNESFPLAIKSTGVGFVYAMGMIGAYLIPYI